MSSLRTPGSRPSEQWPEIIDRLLEGSHAEQVEARETLWVEVKHYVHFAQLPIGPLGDDPDVRSDIALRLLERLEKDDLRRLRHWREGQRSRPKEAVWWAWIRTMARNLATDVARSSRRNLARRGEPYVWARVVPVDPTDIDAFNGAQQEALRRALYFLEDASEEAIENYFDAQQDLRRSSEREDGDGEPFDELSPRSLKRGENGDGGGAP